MLLRLQRLREISCNKSAELVRLYSQVRWLGQYNASLVVRMIEANTLVTDLGARQRALEEELVQAANERDAQRAAAERKAQEAEAMAAELQRKEAELRSKEAELQREKATIAMLSVTLGERDVALARQEAAARSAEAALKEKEDSLSTLQAQANAVLTRLEEAQGDIRGECMSFLLKSILGLLEAYLYFLVQS